MCQTVWIQIRPDSNVNVIPDLSANVFVKVFFMLFALFADFFSQSIFSKKFFQEYHQCVKQFGSRSGICHPPIFFFKTNFFEKFFQKYNQCVKQLGSRSGPTICPA